VADKLALGLFASYQEGWGDYEHAGDIDVNSTRFGGYLTYDSGAGFYINAVVGGGQTGFDIERPIQWTTLSRMADSEPDGWEFFSSVSFGQDVKKGNWTFGPQATLQYSKLELGEFDESGAGVLNLRVHDANSDSLRSYIGGRVAYNLKVTDRFTLIPEARAFWRHEFLDGGSFSSSLDSGSGGRFNYEMQDADKDSFYIGVGLGFLFGERYYLNVYYNADLGRGDDDTHTISISATLRF
jgi:fibronectin-binding autotransporter adhesin